MTSARRNAMAAATVVLAAVVGTIAVQQPWRSDDGTDSGAQQRGRTSSTTQVERTTLTSGLELTGRLGHGLAADVVDQGQGTFTKLPQPGDRIKTGGMLYELNAEPVVMFTGSRPFWRNLTTGVVGPDVQELERNLTDLGYADATDLTVDEKFTEATAAAVKRWQKALGLKQTGGVELGRVIVLRDRVVRVEEVSAKPGETAAAGVATAVLKVTRPDLFATVQLDNDKMVQLAPGRLVTVQLATGASIKGQVQEITLASGSGGTDNGGDPTAGGGGNNQDQATATIRLTDQSAAKAVLDQARPTLTITVDDEKAEHVLVVPVTALLARPEGGYSVRAVRPGKVKPVLVSVKVGLIVGGRAQVTPITGTLHEGDAVVIPS
ncbi:peptidoglycan-binding domain-containing protein [Streptomyces sp. NPDC048279]|uniref:peptidoglycan-binding domain-containing protein n=1 Tax=Streptomyces sp. NPDC048279 TaxID=3154714 RepID=UPI003435260C